MKCPGQDSRLWGTEAISESSCPNCGGPVEFFKDESSRKCRKCGVKVLNPKMDFGCAAYCKFASQCLGTDMPPELLAQRTDLLKDRVAAEVKRLLGRNFKRIGRTLKLVEYAGKIQQSEGGDPAIVTLAAYLTGISEAASVVGGQGFPDDDIVAAESILSRTGAPAEPACEVLSILKNLNGASPLDVSVNYMCIHDAILIAELTDAHKTAQLGRTCEAALYELCLTQTGRRLLDIEIDKSGELRNGQDQENS